MMNCIGLYYLIFILKLLQTDANVNIYQRGVTAGDSHFECGEEFVLMCQIDGYSVMSLQNDSSNVPLAECFLGSCTLDSSVANRYTLSTDTSAGIFNLTFIVSNYNNGTTFMCGDGSKFESSLLLMNDYIPSVIETNQTKQRRVKVMSGCIKAGVTIELRWVKIEANTMKESNVTFDNSLKREYENATLCALDENCGGPDLVKKIVTIDIEEGGTVEYYLGAILSYDGVEVDPIRTSNPYKIKQGFTQSPENMTSLVNNNTSTDVRDQSEGGYLMLWIGLGCDIILFSLGMIVYVTVYRFHNR